MHPHRWRRTSARSELAAVKAGKDSRRDYTRITQRQGAGRSGNGRNPGHFGRLVIDWQCTRIGGGAQIAYRAPPLCLSVRIHTPQLLASPCTRHAPPGLNWLSRRKRPAKYQEGLAHNLVTDLSLSAEMRSVFNARQKLWLIEIRFNARPRTLSDRLAWNAICGHGVLNRGYKIRNYAEYGR
jgi:hypothetical protein